MPALLSVVQLRIIRAFLFSPLQLPTDGSQVKSLGCINRSFQDHSVVFGSTHTLMIQTNQIFLHQLW